MKALCVSFALLCALSLTAAQFTYIFEVQDENRGPKSELFGDLSQYKFIPPSQLPKNPVPARPVPREQPAPQPQPQPISRREDSYEEPREVRRNQRLSGAAQNQRQFVVRAPQQDSRQAIIRDQLNQVQPQQLQPAPQPAPQPIQYQAQPQTSLAVAQPPPQSFPQLAPHQTAHLNPVLRTIVPRGQSPAPALAPAPQESGFELLQNFVRSQSQPNPRPNALQTLGQSQPRYSPQPQSLPPPQPQLQPAPQYNQESRVVLGQSQTGLPTLQIGNRDSLTDADLRAIQEHNRRVQEFLKQRQQEIQNQAAQAARPPSPGRSQALRSQQPPVRAQAVDQNELNNRLNAQRAQIQRQNAEEERARREREHQERVERERLLQKQIEMMLRPETRAEVAPILNSLPLIRNRPVLEAGVEYAREGQPQQPQVIPQQQPRAQSQPQPLEQPEVRPLPVSYNNVRVPDDVRRRPVPRPAPQPTTPAPRNYNIPRTTPAPQPQSNPQNSKPANLGLAALPPDSDADGIPGEAGRDYPTLESIPKTSFSCARQPLSGYYADTETACQVVHLCQFGGVQDSFLCPNGTIWNQEKFSCQWWYEVSCANAPRFYALNQDLYKLPEKDDNLNDNNNNNKK